MPTWKRRLAAAIEALVVVALLGILIFVVIVAVAVVGGSSSNCPGKGGQTMAALMQVQMASVLFKVEQNRYPETLENLVRRPSWIDAKSWPAGGYLPEIPRDAWGRELVYVVPGKTGPFAVGSLGEDGREGGEGQQEDLWLPIRR